MDMEPNLEWTNERIERLPRNNFMYFLFCLLTFRPRKKMTYKEIYLIMVEVNRKSLGEEKAKRMAFRRINYFYEFNHGSRPEYTE